MGERILADRRGGVVFDPSVAPELTPDWFSKAYWRERGAAQALVGGRGGVMIVNTPVGDAVLRHYHRGGSVARLLGDRFLWTGVARVRSVTEFRLLQQLYRSGLPVPQPLGGAWRRSGLYYRADLLTCRVADASSLSSQLDAVLPDLDMAARIGECVGRFHALGVFHADLNAHNILIDTAGQPSVLDFDRGRMLAPRAAWQQSNLRRLHRSLAKLVAKQGGPAEWEGAWWDTLVAAHAAASANGNRP